MNKRYINSISILFLVLLLYILPLAAQEEQGITWPDHWFFLSGDNPDWARPEFNDSGWDKLLLNTFPSKNWTGIGWFRIHLEVDPSQWDKIWGIKVWCAGALEIYLNGELITQIGKVASSPQQGEAEVIRVAYPQIITFRAPPSIVPNSKKQVLAVRYARLFQQPFPVKGLIDNFALSLADYKTAEEIYLKELRRRTFHQTLIVGLSVAFALFHFFLFIFYPKARSNLYFSLVAACTAVVIFSDFQLAFVSQASVMLFFQRLNFIFILLAGLAAMRFIYSLFYMERPKQYLWFLIFGLALCFPAWFSPYVIEPFLRIFLLLVLLEIVRTIINFRLKKAKALIPGGWVIAIGCIPLLFSVSVEQLLKVTNVTIFWEYLALSSAYSLLILMFSMSLFLARDFGRTKKNLEKRTDELTQLNLELEDRVSQRTSEMAEANASLKEQYSKLQESRDHIQKAHTELQDAREELRQAQARLVQSEKLASLGNLVAGIAHEINNPVGAINSAADTSQRSLQLLTQLLKDSSDLDKLTNDPKLQKALDILQSNSRLNIDASARITEIVKSLKSFSRLDQAEFQEADLHEGLDSTLTLMQHEMKDRIEIVRDYGNVPTVYCNPNQINQVFMNILDNAIHSIKEKGTIAIKTTQEGDSVFIRIIDDGVGISKNDIDKIFDPGYTTKGRGVGTGLGLSISFNIIADHKGNIEVKSDIDRGTELTISLPIKPE